MPLPSKDIEEPGPLSKGDVRRRLAPGLRFRTRIALLVLTAIFALVTVTVVAVVLGQRSERQISAVETQYLPLLELDRDLNTLFASIPETLEAAATAAEESGLRDADSRRDAFTRRLTDGHREIADNGGDADALLASFRRYYDVARAVSAGLMAETPAEDLQARIEAMRAAQASFAADLDRATTPDRVRMAEAFGAARTAQSTAVVIDVSVAAGVVLAMILLSWWIIRSTVGTLTEVSRGIERLARGDFSGEIPISSADEFGALAREANRTASHLREYRDRDERADWIKTGSGGLWSEIAGDLDPAALGKRALTYLARYVDAQVGAVYAVDEGGALRLLVSRAASVESDTPVRFAPGEGVIGQAVHDDQVIVLSEVPDGYLRVRSALGEAAPRQLVIVPFGYEGRTMGVMELGFLGAASEQAIELVGRTRDALGVAFRVAESRQRVRLLLEETQRQAEELQVRQDALRATNETLEARTTALQESKRRLQDQQDELQQSNQELELQAEAIERQRLTVVEKNRELEAAQQRLELQAAELQRASQYKSDFLANMSHELRTPLNSVMILSKVLGDNQERNLTEKQVEFARVIHTSGEELLFLINDVLDLAKVEAGKLEVVRESVRLDELVDYVDRMFRPMAELKGLALEVDVAPGLPDAIATDRSKLHQVLKNLLSNAIKFTEAGRIRVRFFAADEDATSGNGVRRHRRHTVGIAVADTGTGIAPAEQDRVFEAFTQADSGISRRHGGTGLGLTIGRQLARLLGGDLLLESSPGAGSTFTVHLPVESSERVRSPSTPVVHDPPSSDPDAVAADQERGEQIQPQDDRAALAPGEPCLLVVEDDPHFAEMVLQVIRGGGFKGLVALDGLAGLQLAERYRPSGIILDVGLPDMDGWSVMQRLKMSRLTRGIPVHFITAGDGADRARQMGAVGFMMKPVAAEQIRGAIHALEGAVGRPVRNVLMVDSADAVRDELCARLQDENAHIETAATAADAAERLRSHAFHCMVLCLRSGDRAPGLELFSQVRADPRTAGLPIVIHTHTALTSDELRRVEGDHPTIVILHGERSSERILEETRLFLHRVRSDLPELQLPDLVRRTPILATGSGSEEVLYGKKVLLVDDDMRNFYSLSSALIAKDLKVEGAADGQEALDALESDPEFDVVLMDIMMPGMDGLEAMRRIRRMTGRERLPIIALTAKTMAGDRQKCLEAGANDYIPKPVDVDQLLSLLRVWLSG